MNDEPTTDDAPTATPVEEEPVDGPDLKLLATGGALIRLADGTEVRLRPPFLGEMQDLRVSFDEVVQAHDDRVNAATRSAVADTTRIRGDLPDDAPLTPELTQALNELAAEGRRQGNALRDQHVADLAGWWERTIAALAVAGTPPAPDRLPAWVADRQSAIDLIEHWRMRPSGRGVRV